MNLTVLGYTLAIISSIFFTLYIIPKKLSKQTPIYYIMFMGIGFFVVSLIIYFGYKIMNPNTIETLFSPILLLSIVSGILWMLGSVLFLTAIDKVGLSRSNQWKNLQGPIGAMLTLIFLAEFLSTNFLYIILAAILIFISAILFNIKKMGEIVSDKKGILYASLSAIFFGTNALIQKIVTNHGLIYSQQVYFSLFVFITAIVYLIVKKKSLSELNNIKSKDNLYAILGGAIYYFASYFSLLAFKLIEGSIAFTIIQLNAVWTIMAGIIIFKEIDFKKNWVRIMTGICFAILGILMLLLAKK